MSSLEPCIYWVALFDSREERSQLPLRVAKRQMLPSAVRCCHGHRLSACPTSSEGLQRCSHANNNNNNNNNNRTATEAEDPCAGVSWVKFACCKGDIISQAVSDNSRTRHATPAWLAVQHTWSQAHGNQPVGPKSAVAVEAKAAAPPPVVVVVKAAVVTAVAAAKEVAVAKAAKAAIAGTIEDEDVVAHLTRLRQHHQKRLRQCH